MNYTHPNKGTCSAAVQLRLEDGKVHDVRFIGGCQGNLQGIAQLVEGMPAQEVIDRLSGIRCGSRGTSCPDQLSRAVRWALEKEKMNASAEGHENF